MYIDDITYIIMVYGIQIEVVLVVPVHHPHSELYLKYNQG